MKSDRHICSQVLRILILSLVQLGNSSSGQSAGTTQGPPDDANKTPTLSVQLGHSYAVMSVAFSSDMKLVLTGGGSGAVLWDVASKREIRRYGADGGMVVSAGFSLDGKLVLTGGFDRVVHLWNVQTGEEIKRFVGHTRTIIGVGFLPDPNLIVSGASDDDGTVRVWDITRGREVR